MGYDAAGDDMPPIDSETAALEAEVMVTAHIIQDLIERHLVDHSLVKQRPHLKACAATLQQAALVMYQQVANINDLNAATKTAIKDGLRMTIDHCYEESLPVSRRSVSVTNQTP